MKLIINPYHEHDHGIGDWERVAFYALAAYFRERLLADPGQMNFIFKSDTLKRLIGFEEVSEGRDYTDRHKRLFGYNDDPRKDAVIDQLFDLVAHSLNIPMELREPERSTRFTPFISIGVSDDLKTYSIELSGTFRRLIVEQYALLIYHDHIKAGLIDPGALEIFETFKGSMEIPIEETDDVTDVIETYTPGIKEINAKTSYRLCIEPVEEMGRIIALRIIEELGNEALSA
jgi:hypothetical protein